MAAVLWWCFSFFFLSFFTRVKFCELHVRWRPVVEIADVTQRRVWRGEEPVFVFNVRNVYVCAPVYVCVVCAACECSFKCSA